MKVMLSARLNTVVLDFWQSGAAWPLSAAGAAIVDSLLQSDHWKNFQRIPGLPGVSVDDAGTRNLTGKASNAESPRVMIYTWTQSRDHYCQVPYYAWG